MRTSTATKVAALACILPALALAQHDGARDSVRHISDGKFELVEKTLAKKKPFAGEAESAFVRMLAHFEQGEKDKARNNADRAVELGIPTGRFHAGEHRIDAIEASPLIHGPMVGNVTGSSASFWVRTSKASEVVVKHADGKTSEPGRSTAQSDFTAVVTLEGLKPDTDQSYSILIDGKEMATGEFRTFPTAGKAGTFSVAFGGGAGFVPEWERMWDNILGFEPNALLMLGDNIYIDQPESTLTNHYCYHRRQSRPEWRRLTARTPTYSIWDDHDFGTNDCVPGPEIEEPAWKRDVWEIFRQNWVNPAYGGGEKQPGCWYDFHLGDVHFVMLDGRYYRDLKGGSMLGPVQKAWLLKTLADSKATFKVIASPVPFTAGIKKGSKDPWDGFPEEREEIFQHLEKERIEGVFLIAADRHRTDLRITKRPSGYDLYEFESSRLTNHHTHSIPGTEGLVWGYNKTCSFGLMRFDTTAADPQVTFECIDIDGVKRETFVLRRSQLQF